LLQNFKGLFGSDRLSALIEGAVKVDDLLAAPFQFHIGAVNLTSGEMEYISKDDTGRAGEVLKYILASASLPFVLPSVSIGGSTYCDGGARHIVPIHRAVSDGATQIVCIVCGTGKISQSDDINQFMPLLNRLTSIATNQYLRYELELLRKSNQLFRTGDLAARALLSQKQEVAEPVLIQPREDYDFSIISFEVSNIAAMIADGERMAQEVLDRL
jgi:NTE family protein